MTDTQQDAPPRRPWWRKKRWIVPLALVALLVAAGVAGGGDAGEQPAGDTEPASTDGSGGEGASEAPAGPQRAAVGEAAVDGQFTFRVTGLECGAATVGEGALAEDAQGQWCVLTATVANSGDEPRGLSASAQLLYDEQGREFQASLPLAATEQQSPIYQQINPGNSVEGRFFFDVPADGFQPSHVQLHDSVFSGGVEVDLGG